MKFEEMTRRIEAIDGNILRNMIQNKVLPEDILTEYFKVKTILDRVSGAFAHSTLAMIVLKCQEESNLGAPLGSVLGEPKIKELLKSEEPEPEPVVPQATEEEKAMTTPEKKEVEYVPAEPEPEETEKWPEGAYKKDTVVTAFIGGSITEGKIVNAYYSDEDNDEGLTYQVEIEGTDDPIALPAEDVELKED